MPHVKYWPDINNYCPRSAQWPIARALLKTKQNAGPTIAKLEDVPNAVPTIAKLEAEQQTNKNKTNRHYI